MLGLGAYLDAMTGSWCLERLRSRALPSDAQSAFTTTLAISLAQGAIIALEIAVLAAAVLGARAVFGGARRVGA